MSLRYRWGGTGGGRYRWGGAGGRGRKSDDGQRNPRGGDVPSLPAHPPASAAVATAAQAAGASQNSTRSSSTCSTAHAPDLVHARVHPPLLQLLGRDLAAGQKGRQAKAGGSSSNRGRDAMRGGERLRLFSATRVPFHLDRLSAAAISMPSVTTLPRAKNAPSASPGKMYLRYGAQGGTASQAVVSYPGGGLGADAFWAVAVSRHFGCAPAPALASRAVACAHMLLAWLAAHILPWYSKSSWGEPEAKMARPCTVRMAVQTDSTGGKMQARQCRRHSQPRQRHFGREGTARQSQMRRHLGRACAPGRRSAPPRACTRAWRWGWTWGRRWGARCAGPSAWPEG